MASSGSLEGSEDVGALWINAEILYSVDYNRGIDILRFTGKP